MSGKPYVYFDAPTDDADDECPECGGEGFVASCVSDYACVDPEEGCDLCMRRCDYCRPLPTPPEAKP